MSRNHLTRFIGILIALIITIIINPALDTAFSGILQPVADAGYGWVITAINAILAIADIYEFYLMLTE